MSNGGSDKKDKELETLRQDCARLQSQLDQTMEQLGASEHLTSLGELLVGVAHELNNPINFVANSFAAFDNQLNELKLEVFGLLPDSEEGDEVRDLLGRRFSAMNELGNHHRIGTDRIRRIIVGLSNFTRTNMNRKETADINEVLEETMLILNNRLKRVKVIYEPGADLPSISCARGAIGQVFLNLSTNGLDAAEEVHEPGNVVLKLRTSFRGKYVSMAVIDNGPGIPPELRDRIFAPFVTTKPVGKGTGMGLPISQRIIENHGGTMSLWCGVDGGTEFQVNIPCLMEGDGDKAKP